MSGGAGARLTSMVEESKQQEHWLSLNIIDFLYCWMMDQAIIVVAAFKQE
jgi:hypothetical protein